jgi:hypothetical protein
VGRLRRLLLQHGEDIGSNRSNQLGEWLAKRFGEAITRPEPLRCDRIDEDLPGQEVEPLGQLEGVEEADAMRARSADGPQGARLGAVVEAAHRADWKAGRRLGGIDHHQRIDVLAPGVEVGPPGKVSRTSTSGGRFYGARWPPDAWSSPR